MWEGREWCSGVGRLGVVEYWWSGRVWSGVVVEWKSLEWWSSGVGRLGVVQWTGVVRSGMVEWWSGKVWSDRVDWGGVGRSGKAN